jgi:hypothetical protein
MSNQHEAKFVSGNFAIQSFLGVHGKISSKTLLVPKGMVCPEFLIQQTNRVPTVVNHKSPTIWSRIMCQRKAERPIYHNAIRDLRSFSQSEAQKFSPIQVLFCPKQISAVLSMHKIS